MPTVTASEFVRNFGKYREQVAREQITVTDQGKVTGVFISADDAALLALAKESRQACHVRDLPADLRDAVRTAAPDDEMLALDRLMEDR